MEEVQSTLGFFRAYWPLITTVILVSVISQLLKSRFLTARLASKNRAVFWIRRAFPLLLIAFSGTVGAVWPGEVVPGVVDPLHKIALFMTASCVSITGYSILRTWVKKKYDVDISSELDAENIRYPRK